MRRPESSNVPGRPTQSTVSLVLKTWLHRTLVGILIFGAAWTAWAERYLTVAEAQRVCFPEADRFEVETARFNAEQIKAIADKIGIKVSNRENEIHWARHGTNLAGVLIIDHVLSKHEFIDYAVALSPDGTVRQVEILEYRERYGREIREKKWRDQFKGKTVASKLRLNDDVYNISGATISCRHITEGVKRVLATFEVVVRPRLRAAGGLPDSGAAAKP